jgi:riboflavin synthase
MFTGIVEELGELVRLERTVATVRGPRVAVGSRPGDSVAVNGVCLTVVESTGDCFSVDVMQETFDRSSLGTLAPGDPVNLEQAATVTSRLGGHLVQGHVDGVGTILSRTPGEAPAKSVASAAAPPFAPAPDKAGETVRVALPPGLARYVVEKGSIAVDGVSLTVVEVTGEWFEVGLIPTTLALTTLGRKGVGELVNLEVDIIAKYVEKLVTGVRS